IHLDITKKSIVVSNCKSEKVLIQRQIEECMKNSITITKSSHEELCPICFCGVDDDLIILACDHKYCRECFCAYIKSTEVFPIKCLSKNCNNPLLLNDIKSYVQEYEFNNLLQKSFNLYISQHAELYFYCKTPDCTQIFNKCPSSKDMLCTQCFSSICVSCAEFAHEGQTCAEYQRTKNMTMEDKEFEKWKNANKVKLCKNCGASIQKGEGCQHVTCAVCKSHICWFCLNIFDKNVIYQHMRSMHGGI
ncbi:hypothetical protein ROZALSC1DRAFT_9489, partial [Rozella allomycis CSF55]